MEKKLAQKSFRGFTLIELLIVISIIGILVTFVSASYTGAQKQARDSQRRSDLMQYKVALENYAASNSGKYVGFDDPLARYAITTGNLCSAGSFSFSLMNYMSNNCILDPKTSGTCNDTPTSGKIYCFISGGNGTDGATASDYIFFGGLETGGWWVVCTNGKSGKTTVIPPVSMTCPL